MSVVFSCGVVVVVGGGIAAGFEGIGVVGDYVADVVAAVNVEYGVGVVVVIRWGNYC